MAGDLRELTSGAEPNPPKSPNSSSTLCLVGSTKSGAVSFRDGTKSGAVSFGDGPKSGAISFREFIAAELSAGDTGRAELAERSGSPMTSSTDAGEGLAASVCVSAGKSQSVAP